MVGTLGVLKSVPRPSTSVIQEALNLLSVMGGSKDAKKLLVTMQEVQVHNQEVAEQARVVIAEANERLQKVAAAEVLLEQKTRTAEHDFLVKLEAVTVRETAAQTKIGKIQAELTRRLDGLSVIKRDLVVQRTDDEKALRDEKARLTTVEADLSGREDDLRTGTAALSARKETLETDIAYVDSHRLELEELKAKLDARDARVLAAMENAGD